MLDRLFDMYECDHMRPLVHLEGEWHHLLPDGRVGGVCGASSVYQVRATITGNHNVITFYRMPGGK